MAVIISFQCQHGKPLRYRNGVWETWGTTGRDHAPDCHPAWRIEDGRKVPVAKQLAALAR